MNCFIQNIEILFWSKNGEILLIQKQQWIFLSKISIFFLHKYRQKSIEFFIQNLKKNLSKTLKIFYPKLRIYFIQKIDILSTNSVQNQWIFFYPKILLKTYKFFCPKYRFFYPQILHKLFIFFYLKYQDFFFKEKKNLFKITRFFYPRNMLIKNHRFFFSFHIFSR